MYVSHVSVSAPIRSDLHVVMGGTSSHALGLVVKQLRSLGIPYLHDIAGLAEKLILLRYKYLA